MHFHSILDAWVQVSINMKMEGIEQQNAKKSLRLKEIITTQIHQYLVDTLGELYGIIWHSNGSVVSLNFVGSLAKMNISRASTTVTTQENVKKFGIVFSRKNSRLIVLIVLTGLPNLVKRF